MAHFRREFELEAEYLFDLKITGKGDVIGDEILKNFKSNEFVRKRWTDATKVVVENTATLFANRMKLYLSKGYRHSTGYAVGASEEAMRNIFVDVPQSKGGTPTATSSVFEGTDSKHNYWIRHGWRGAGSSNRIIREKLVPMRKVKEYLADKNITLMTPTGVTTALGPTYVPLAQYKRYKTGRAGAYKSGYQKASKATKKKIEVALGYLQIHMSQGSWNTQLNDLYPEGRPYFDYAALAMRRSADLWDKVDSLMNYIIEGEIKWLSSSRPNQSGGSEGGRRYTYMPNTK